jgi:hypothetical protein
MRANQVLVAKGWCWVSADVNNREGVFRLSREVQMLREVLCAARKFYEFEVRGLRVEADKVRRFAYEGKSCIGAERLVLVFCGCQQSRGGVPVAAGGAEVARGAVQGAGDLRVSRCAGCGSRWIG